MRAYKGFNKNDDGTINCRGFVYEIGKTYKYDGEIKICLRGFHACHELHQVWTFYPNNGNNVFCEVECGGDIVESGSNDGKFVCSEITILNEVDVSGVEKFNESTFFFNGFSVIRKGTLCNFITPEGKLVSCEWLDAAWHFSYGFAVVKKMGQYNHIGMDGEMLSEEWWDDAYGFENGYARVKKGEKYNLIDTKGQLVSDEWFEYRSYVHEGKAKVKQDGIYYMFNVNTKTKELFVL